VGGSLPNTLQTYINNSVRKVVVVVSKKSITIVMEKLMAMSKKATALAREMNSQPEEITIKRAESNQKARLIESVLENADYGHAADLARICSIILDTNITIRSSRMKRSKCNSYLECVPYMIIAGQEAKIPSLYVNSVIIPDLGGRVEVRIGIDGKTEPCHGSLDSLSWHVGSDDELETFFLLCNPTSIVSILLNTEMFSFCI